MDAHRACRQPAGWQLRIVATVAAAATLASSAYAVVAVRPRLKPQPFVLRPAPPGASGNAAPHLLTTERQFSSLGQASQLSIARQLGQVPGLRPDLRALLAQTTGADGRPNGSANGSAGPDLSPLFASLKLSQRTSQATLARKIDSMPLEVLRGLAPRLAAAATGLSLGELRRVLVAMQHGDKVQVSEVRGSARFGDAEVAAIADDLCALLLERALPRSNEPQPAAAIADAFVDALQKAQAVGLRRFAAAEPSAFATAAKTIGDPLLEIKVSHVRTTREDGAVDFRITHPRFSAQVRHETYSFAMEVAKHPNTPNVEELSLLPAAWVNFGDLKPLRSRLQPPASAAGR